jgi:hypothetical protein
VSPDGSIALSALLHGGFLVAGALTATLHSTDDDRYSRDQTYFGQQYLVAAAEQEEADPAALPAQTDPDGDEPSLASSDGHRGGSTDAPRAPDTAHRYGVQGPADSQDAYLARRPARLPDLDLYYLLYPPDDGRWGGDPDAPVDALGGVGSLGSDPASARGYLRGKELGASFGSPSAGLGLRRACPACSGRGSGAFPASGSAEGGATGTERAALW